MNKTGSKHLRPSYLLFVISAVLLLALRIVLKLNFIDFETGFYDGEAVYMVAFYALYALTVLGLWLMSCSGRAPIEAKPLQSISGIGWAAALLGLATEYKAGMDGYLIYEKISAAGVRMSILNMIVSVITILVAAAAGVVLLIMAVNISAGAMRKYSGTAILAIPVLHRCFALVERFTTNVSSIAMSDDVLEIFMFSFAVLFMIGHARLISRINIGRGHKLVELTGYACALTTVLIWIPQIIGAVLHRFAFTSQNSATLLCDAALMIYCILFTKRVTQTP